MKKKDTQETKNNNFLLSIITPIGLEIKSLVIGENTGRVYGIIKYILQELPRMYEYYMN